MRLSPWREILTAFVILMLITAALVVAKGRGKGSTEAPAKAFAATAPAGLVIGIDNFNFDPPTLTVAVGSTVTWVNHDDVPHTVTANDKAFGSKAMDTDDRFSHAFPTPGVYPYFCAVHPHMTGQIIVK